MRIFAQVRATSFLLLAMVIPANAATAAPAETSHGDTFEIAYNACNGEFIQLEGHYNRVLKPQKGIGYIASFTLHGQGIGQSGNKYVINANEKDRFTDIENYSVDYYFLVVSKGSAPNHWLKVHIDDEGNFDVQEDCRG